MNNRKVLLSVVITLVVVAALFAGGYAIYRFGYTRGAAGSFAGPMMRGFAGEFGNERGMPFHEFNGQGDFQQRMPMPGYRSPRLCRAICIGWVWRSPAFDRGGRAGGHCHQQFSGQGCPGYVRNG